MLRYLRLARVANAVIIFLSVECAAILSGANIAHNGRVLAAAIAASLITVGGNMRNNLFDIDVLKVNSSRKPAVLAKTAPDHARTISIALIAAGLVISEIISLPVFIIAVIGSLLIVLYSYKLKPTVFFGNLTVALLAGTTFIYGGAVVNDFRDVYPAALFAFMTNLIREIIKDGKDVEMDKKTGVRTIATEHGTRFSALLSIILTIILLALVWAAYQTKILPIQFLTVCGLTIFPIGIYIIYLLQSRRSFSEASFGYKLMMVFGLVALIVGKV